MTKAAGIRNVAIFGATSAMAEHTARRLAARGDRLALVARNPGRLAAVAADLGGLGAGVVITRIVDLAGLMDPGALLDDLAAALGGLDAVLLFQGVLGDRGQADSETASANGLLDVNLVGPALLSLAAIPRLEAGAGPRGGVLLAIGSVAGDRGRASNFIYGAAKGGLAVLYQGLHHRLAREGSRVRAVIVKAGFVDTPMTANFDKSGPLWARPGALADIIVAAMDRGGPILYAPFFWRWIMLAIRLLPQGIMDRLDL